MKKIEIEFPCDFESNTYQPLPIGRINIGKSVGRLFFGIDGKIHMWLPQSAMAYIHTYNYDEDKLYGFGRTPVVDAVDGE